MLHAPADFSQPGNYHPLLCCTACGSVHVYVCVCTVNASGCCCRDEGQRTGSPGNKRAWSDLSALSIRVKETNGVCVWVILMWSKKNKLFLPLVLSHSFFKHNGFATFTWKWHVFKSSLSFILICSLLFWISLDIWCGNTTFQISWSDQIFRLSFSFPHTPI